MTPRTRRAPKRFRPDPLLAALFLLVSAFQGGCYPLGDLHFLILESPERDQDVGASGVEVLVRFAPSDRVAPETFRCTLNGVDVTGLLTTGENGAAGHLYGLLDGDNVLRLEIFGRTWWSGDSLVEESREVHLRLRRRLDLFRG